MKYKTLVQILEETGASRGVPLHVEDPRGLAAHDAKALRNRQCEGCGLHNTLSYEAWSRPRADGRQDEYLAIGVCCVCDEASEF